jgi:hypothetical protein
MFLLVLRIAIAPLIVAAGTLVQRRFGNAIGGLVIGLPLTSLVLLWLVALQHGSAFASSMSGAILIGTTSQVAVIWVYAALAPRISPALAMAAALGTFVLGIGVLNVVNVSVLFASVLAAAGFAVALYWWPYTDFGPQESGRYRLVLRIIISASFTLFLVVSAGRLGPGFSGLIAALPMMSLLMAYLTHRELGANASAQFLHGVTKGSFAYVASMYVLAVLLRTGDVAVAFVAATFVGLFVQLAVQAYDSLPSLQRAVHQPLATLRVSLKN